MRLRNNEILTDLTTLEGVRNDLDIALESMRDEETYPCTESCKNGEGGCLVCATYRLILSSYPTLQKERECELNSGKK